MTLLTVPQAAERLGVRPSTVRFWIWQRRIAFVRVGRCIRIGDETIDALIARGTVPARRGA